MRTYLAEAGLRPHLALLPKYAELGEQKNLKVRGEFGEKELDFRSLKEAPHKIFVNWPNKPEDILAFTKRYGLLDPNGKYCPWKLNQRKYDREATKAAKFADPRSRIFTSGSRITTFSFSVASWIEAQKYFREYWNGNATWDKWDVVRLDLISEFMPSEIAGTPPKLRHPGLVVDDLIVSAPNSLSKPLLVFTAMTLWQYLCALLAFHKVGELRNCENLDCPAPRFIARRKDQVYCSNDCAGLIAKRRWWAKHGEQWRQQRLRTKLKGGKR